VTVYLLDTNHASPLVTLSHPLRQRVLARVETGDQFAVCVPVIAETIFGIGLLLRAVQNLAEWDRLKPFLPCYIPDETDAKDAAHLKLALRRQGWQLDTVDALIAVIAVRHRLTLLTTNRDFQTVPKLQQENWLASL
jgi:predicted nucleic acid-binding protein